MPLISTMSMSESFNPASQELQRCGTGPIPMISGSTPAYAQLTIFPSGVRPSHSHSSRSQSPCRRAVDYSDAFPAVTKPSLLKAGSVRKPIVVSGRR